MIPRCFISNHIYSQHAVQYGVGGIFKVFFLCDDVHSAGAAWRGEPGCGRGLPGGRAAAAWHPATPCMMGM